MTDLLASRYASPEMAEIFSDEHKYLIWRRLWIALATSQQELGLSITDAQIQSLHKHAHTIPFDRVRAHEEQCHHDVMAHILTFAEQCPEARGIIHWGATSCFVTDNGDLIQFRAALHLIQEKLVQVIRQLHHFAKRTATIPTLSYTHLQPAQPTTVGKRAALWIQDLVIDLEEVEHTLLSLRFLGVKGATGTQASFLSLFNGDHDRVEQLEARVASKIGFAKVFPVSGQTYTRKQDIRILSTLTSFAASAHKMATDLRLLAHLGEIEEPFKASQVGSSAMPHKRNPMRSERICGLARFLISLQENPLYTEATQWFERSLDDSSNRRLYFPQAFLTADAILQLLLFITSSLGVNPKVIQKNLDVQIPFLATETLLMAAVKKGKDRQIVHERLRSHCLVASSQIKEEGSCPDLFALFASDPQIGLSLPEIHTLCRPELFVGRAAEQTHLFLENTVEPLLQRYRAIPDPKKHTPL